MFLLTAEYAYTTKVDEKIDVYSFGVVLLELVTGREPNSGEEHTSLAEWAWKLYAEEKPIVDALDKEIKEPRYLEEMMTVFKLGLKCTSSSPYARPSMKDTLHILHRCKPFDDFGRKKPGKDHDVAPLLGKDGHILSYKSNSKKLMDESDNSLVSLV